MGGIQRPEGEPGVAVVSPGWLERHATLGWPKRAMPGQAYKGSGLYRQEFQENPENGKLSQQSTLTDL